MAKDEKEVMRYIAKPNTWFDEGTVAYLVDDYRKYRNSFLYDSGLFSGYHNGKEDEEICPFDEFYLDDSDEIEISK